MYTMPTPTPVREMGNFVLVDLSLRRCVWSCSGLRLSYFIFYLRAVVLLNLSLSFVLLPLHRPNTFRRHVVAHLTSSWSYGIQCGLTMRQAPSRAKPELGSGGSELALTHICMIYRLPRLWIGIVSPVFVSSRYPPYQSRWLLKP